ncbi:MAG: carboxypeptidase regulatory-like domain-containing protein [Acidobacteria bacterium]|nr:carboxypeptidase regulatory-like domain-containing protein [Acidobacteriota bacterium]
MKNLVRSIAVVLCAASAAFAQNVSSTVLATIVDPSGAAIPGAECVLTNTGTGTTIPVKSDTQGTCTFAIVPSGSYELSAKASGFKTLDVHGIAVTAGETRTLGQLRLEVGALAESVQVTGEISQIQLATAEKSGTITMTQLQNVAVKGRDMFALMTTIPGIVDNMSQARETTSPDSLRGTFINGSRENSKNYSVDGITNLDTGSNNTLQFEPNMDSIAEVKVLTSNFQAEYGRNGGGVITVITRGGGRDFHASGYDTYRHESLNANSFWNNRQNVAKAPYRYRITGYTVGGPVYIPGKFNTKRDKIFFFWNQEYTGQRKDYGTRYATMPTAAERQGDFSKSVTGSGTAIRIIDPLNGVQFPGNVIPKTRFSTLGQAMLNFLPLPNYTDPNPAQVNNWNYKSTYTGAYPKREDMVRIDVNPTSTLQVYWRYVQDKDEQQSPYGLWINGGVNYLLAPVTFGQPGKGHVIHVTKSITSTMVNEFIFGKSKNRLYFYPTDASLIDRAKVGNPGQWYTDTSTGVSYLDKSNYMPNLTFGGNHANPVVATFGNIPYENYNNITSFVDNISKVIGQHTLKAGFYFEHTQKFQVGGTNPRGAFNFSSSTTNPFDTGDGFSNALIGVINTYSEATQRVNGNWFFNNLEFYVQDNWRVSKRLTLDIGMRFYHLPPQTDDNHTIAGFNPGLYSRANAPMLYMPTIDPATGKRVAVDPRTGTLYANPLIGLFIPNTGSVSNGAAIGGQNGYPGGLYTTGSIYYGPRLGFAWDVFGNGRTALRGGIGMFQDRLQGNPTMNTNGNPPVAFSPTLYYGNLDTYASSGGAIGPSGINNLLGHNNPATTINWSFGVQHQLKDFAVEASYVGSAAYHLIAGKDLNPIPMGAHFNTAYQDPSQPGKPLADNFLRPYYGWGSITTLSNAYNSNYHSLQVSAQRRFARGLQVGVAYTFSKALDVADGDTSTVSPYFAPRFRNYGRAGFDRPQQFVANYVYSLPMFGTRMNFRPAKWVLDNWEISGVTSFISGSPFTPGLGWTTSQDVTGSAEGARVNIVGSCGGNGTHTFNQWFNTGMAAPPVIGSWGNPNVTMANFGNAGVNVCTGPGINNWDLAISKRFPLFGEGRFVQFRTEMFNAFNHTQYSGVNTGTSFNAATGVQTSPTYGQISGSRNGRIMALSLRVSF